MRTYVDGMRASGGGDGPEAVTAGLHQALNMNWRKEATKISVLIADAPPHGLEPSGDGFPNGDPDGHDPLVILKAMAAQAITCYAVGCEPALGSYRFARDFMCTVAEITGGQAIALDSANALPSLIMGASAEALNLQKIVREVQEEVRATLEAEGVTGLTEEALADHYEREDFHAKVATNLRSKGIRTKQMQNVGESRLAGKWTHQLSHATSLKSAKEEICKAAETEIAAGATDDISHDCEYLRSESLSDTFESFSAPAPRKKKSFSGWFSKSTKEAAPHPGVGMVMSGYAPTPARAVPCSIAPKKMAEASYEATEDEISTEQVSRMMKRSAYAMKSKC
jgi:hypothetical protein